MRQSYKSAPRNGLPLFALLFVLIPGVMRPEKIQLFDLTCPPESSCTRLSFSDVSTKMWGCFKDAVGLQMNVRFDNPNAGQVKLNGSTVNYNFDPGNKQLVFVAKSAWWRLVTCGEINQRISEFLLDCRGPRIDLLAREGNVERWRVDRPEVKQSDTSYQLIRLRQGDRVRIDAGGCVQTGGPGKTWRQYVDPTGPDSGSYYHGLIRLPGMGSSLTLRKFVTDGNNFLIRTNESDMSLHLGYQDKPDQYANNGYWGKDVGFGNQCAQTGNAWVEITIYRAAK